MAFPTGEAPASYDLIAYTIVNISSPPYAATKARGSAISTTVVEVIAPYRSDEISCVLGEIHNSGDTGAKGISILDADTGRPVGYIRDLDPGARVGFCASSSAGNLRLTFEPGYVRTDSVSVTAVVDEHEEKRTEAGQEITTYVYTVTLDVSNISNRTFFAYAIGTFYANGDVVRVINQTFPNITPGTTDSRQFEV